MNRVLLTGLLLASMLVATTGSVLAGSALELISVTNGGGGPAFTFRVSGEFSPSQLKGSGQVSGGEGFPLHCARQDETTVICHAPKKISGQSVSVTFGGATFWTDVPQPQLGGGGGNSQYCYSLWANIKGTSVSADNIYIGGVLVAQSAAVNNTVNLSYQDFGPICQDAPANEHDIVILDIGGGYQTYGFFDPSPASFCSPDHGSAYYTRFTYTC